jgi:Cu+-exporting ATPase
VEKASEHPTAAAIVAAAAAQGGPIGDVQDFHASPGKGASGKVDGHLVLLGTSNFLQENAVETKAVSVRAEELRTLGQTIVLVAVDGRYAGLLGVVDPIRETSSGAIQMLRSQGIRVVMLTGDSQTTAQAVAKAVGIDEVIAGVLPTEKGNVVRRLREQGRKIAMAGDGINDAPALAMADVGIAMGTGTDIAMESAGITLVRPDLHNIPRARRLSQATVRTIRENLFLAFVYNISSIPAAALGILHPVWAALAMSLSSLSVVANSLRLQAFKD